MFAVRREHPVKAGQVDARLRHQSGQSCDEVQGVEDDVGGAVAVRCLQLVANVAVGGQRQPLFRYRGRIFKALLSGDNTINGFRNQDIRTRLAGSPFLRTCGRCAIRQSAKISRLLKRCHIYGLIAKVPRSRRWRLTKIGLVLLSAAIALKEQTFPGLLAQATA